ncbi:hypothetical protein BLX41_13730 [Pseudomonas protegens]|uniref:hypothetical protein n=1 Tax=Pseudomonas protegens TaxID=380021 RepID=UPI000F4C3CE2|nr:hypothetical protein [Pseudomonas protegens]ROL76924.1 hypothetical protein BLX41_13730 [Pseudomonas protegens]
MVAVVDLDVGFHRDSIECTAVLTLLQLLQITDTVVRDHVHTGLLTALDLEIEEQLSPFGVMLRKDEPQSRELEIFLNRLRERARG